MTDANQSKPIQQVALWELAAALCLGWILREAPASDPWAVRFVTNACFFLLAYPLFMFLRHGEALGLVRFLLIPLGFLLRIGLVVSAYFWAAFLFWSFQGIETLNLMFKRPLVLGLLFALLYGAWIGRLWGTAGKPLGSGDAFRLTLTTFFAGGIGFVLGKGMERILGGSFPDPAQRLWITAVLTLFFAILGAWIAKTDAKSQGKEAS